ncbi:hypothetical protein [Rhodopseudomonas pseudopalustris]|uniref:Uncharacterized protein n=1 Tax=Rhodopseudomonas pseudopalustris TaxID=1513892 RepID=A0A1H8UGR8_9BRAD|nr:hypothetical protein [Rhodopseudomonas pseudopalustris]SEP02419.1 hypothetical protein SAMN05444123_10744 [Rhodopseudomonas pseudopalustris]
MTINQTTAGLNDAGTDASASARRTDVILIRLSKAVAVLFAVALTTIVFKVFLGIATEPKPLGGIDLAKMPDAFMPWTPVYYPLILAALFAWWRWPSNIIKPGAWALLRGGFVMAQIAVVCIFVCFLCAQIGQLTLTIPFALSAELWKMLLSSVAAALSYTLTYAMFFATSLFPLAIAFGLILALMTQSLRRRLVGDAEQGIDESHADAFVTWQPSRSPGVHFDRPIEQRIFAGWPSVLAGGFVLVLLLLSFLTMGPFILMMWAHGLISTAIPCLIIGASFRWLGFGWSSCAVAGGLLSLYFGYDSMQHNGFLTGQLISAPPVVGATMGGFWIFNAIHPRHRQRPA